MKNLTEIGFHEVGESFLQKLRVYVLKYNNRPLVIKSYYEINKVPYVVTVNGIYCLYHFNKFYKYGK